ncbi:MAG: hypothetical protein ACFCBV_13710 [Phycisphaerales bacterium]
MPTVVGKASTIVVGMPTVTVGASKAPISPLPDGRGQLAGLDSAISIW